ncbi:MAG TPA: type I phosphomannose isomerase catalytic subunit [Candidatus Dormibacteraeota bacterium]|nr:type I phosphomannose isomerase catalytic subunit [Candidatus Dormibacteraeota bacterium]
MKPEPFRIDPIFSERIWGAHSLAPLFPNQTNLYSPIGEAWLTGLDCRTATGTFAGKTLREAWQQMPPDWRGSQLAAISDFPLLVKFIFPNDKLSIQVHPDDTYAAAHEQAAGGRGKTEMWHAISVEPGAQVLVGLKPGVDKPKFLAALAAHTIEDLFEPLPVHAGDTFYVPAGTPHTIGPKMILCEVQEYSDLTYRIDDFGRLDAHGKPRELHIEKALAVMDFGPPKGGKVPPLALNADDHQATLLCACPYFAVERLKFSEPLEFPADPGHFQLLIILTGRGNLGWPDTAARYNPGECWLLPATLDQATLHPLQPTTLLRTYVPNLPTLQQRLSDAGISASAISQSVFR